MRKEVIVWTAIAGLHLAAGCTPPGGGSTDQDILLQQGGVTIPNGFGELFLRVGSHHRRKRWQDIERRSDHRDKSRGKGSEHFLRIPELGRHR
jgi:hypothetical protein